MLFKDVAKAASQTLESQNGSSNCEGMSRRSRTSCCFAPRSATGKAVCVEET